MPPFNPSPPTSGGCDDENPLMTDVEQYFSADSLTAPGKSKNLYDIMPFNLFLRQSCANGFKNAAFCCNSLRAVAQ
jgi:hypothetical protein